MSVRRSATGGTLPLPSRRGESACAGGTTPATVLITSGENQGLSISTVALVSAEAMNYYAVDMVTFGARCTEVQVLGHFIDSKDPKTRGKTNQPEGPLAFLRRPLTRCGEQVKRGESIAVDLSTSPGGTSHRRR